MPTCGSAKTAGPLDSQLDNQNFARYVTPRTIGWMGLDVAFAHCMKGKIFLKIKAAQDIKRFVKQKGSPQILLAAAI